MVEKHQVLPDAERIMSSLRDTGYTFPAAIADLVDNSIAASATDIKIHINMDLGGAIQVSVADNGSGMDKNKLLDAMKYGAPREKNSTNLGKFGLGLKTASTSYCKLLEVTTKAASGSVNRATWDLDHIAQVNSWELKMDSPDRDTLKLLDEVADSKSGTVVVWKNIDRLLQKDYKIPGGGFAQNALDRHIKDLRFHLGMIFQRFIDPRPEWGIQRQIRIEINGDSVDAWDPFCIGLSEKLAERKVDIAFDGGVSHPFVIRAYVLPSLDEYPSEEARNRANPSIRLQGIYVYRHNRLLQYGDWLGITERHNMKNNLRVELSFDHFLDDVFKVPVDKSYIELDSEIAIDLSENFIARPIAEAENRRELSVRRRKKGNKEDMHKGSNIAIGEKAEAVITSNVVIKNPVSGEAQLTSRSGEKVTLKIPVVEPKREGQYFIQAVDSLLDGALYAPARIDDHPAVQINQNHPFYRKIYEPLKTIGIAIQGMDTFIWALCQAEQNTATQSTIKLSRDIRNEVSRILRELVEQYDDPVAEEDEE